MRISTRLSNLPTIGVNIKGKKPTTAIDSPAVTAL